MLKLFRNWYTRPYASEHLRLAINFVVDARGLFQKEKSTELGKYGYAGYLRVDCNNGGITDPLTLLYVRRRFGEFIEITQVCDGIEAKFREYDADFWSDISNSFVKNRADHIRENRHDFKYLKQFLPTEDIASILLRP